MGRKREEKKIRRRIRKKEEEKNKKIQVWNISFVWKSCLEPLFCLEVWNLCLEIF